MKLCVVSIPSASSRFNRDILQLNEYKSKGIINFYTCVHKVLAMRQGPLASLQSSSISNYMA